MSFSIAGNIRFLTDPKVEQNNSNVVKFLVGTEERKVNDKYVDNQLKIFVPVGNDINIVIIVK